MRAVICPTSWGKDTFQLIKSGIIKSMSFGFNVIEDEWTNTRSDVANRIVKDLHLIEVSAVRNPAYLSSAISARGMELVEDIEIREEEVTEEVVNTQPIETVQVEEKVEVDQEVEQVKDNSTNVENDIQTMMKKMFEQFENILSAYVPKPQEATIEQTSSTIQEEPTQETVVEDVQAVNEEVASKEEETVEQQQVINNEEVDETVNKSQIDYAIELLSKYKKIQELQR